MANAFTNLDALTNKLQLAKSLKPEVLPEGFMQVLVSSVEQQRMQLVQSYVTLHGDEGQTLVNAALLASLDNLAKGGNKPLSTLAGSLKELLDEPDLQPQIRTADGAAVLTPADEGYNEAALGLLEQELAQFNQIMEAQNPQVEMTDPSENSEESEETPEPPTAPEEPETVEK